MKERELNKTRAQNLRKNKLSSFGVCRYGLILQVYMDVGGGCDLGCEDFLGRG